MGGPLKPNSRRGRSLDDQEYLWLTRFAIEYVDHSGPEIDKVGIKLHEGSHHTLNRAVGNRMTRRFERRARP